MEVERKELEERGVTALKAAAQAHHWRGLKEQHAYEHH